MREISPERVAQMTPENRMKYEKKLRQVKRNRKIITAAGAVAAVAVVAAVLSFTVLFNIRTIKVENKNPVYTKKEITTASGLNIGDSIFQTDFEKAGKKIEEELPYVKKAVITKKLSGDVVIKIENDEPVLVFAVGKGYAVADSEGKVLELMSAKPADSKLIVLKAAEKMTAVPGKPISFEKKGSGAESYKDVCRAFASAKLLDKVTEIDVTDVNSLVVIYENRFRIKLGPADELENKAEAVARTISMEDETHPGGVAEINAFNYKKIYVDPLDSLQDKVTVVYQKPENEEMTTETEKTEESEENENNSGEENSEGVSQQQENTDENVTENSEAAGENSEEEPDDSEDNEEIG